MTAHNIPKKIISIVHKVIHFPTLILLFAITTIVTGSFASAATFAEPVRLDGDWQYRWGDSPRTNDRSFEWLASDSKQGWELADQPDNVKYRPIMKNGQPVDLLWMRVQLPDHDCRNCSIWFEDLTRIYEVYLNGVKIDGFGDLSPGKPVPFVGESSNFITLPTNHSGQWLTLRVQSDTRFIGIAGHVWYGESENVLNLLLQRSAPAIAIGAGAFFIGLLYILAWTITRKDHGLLWFGLYASSMGMMYSLREKSVILTLDGAIWPTFIVLSVYMVGIVFFIRYFVSRFGEGPHRVLHWLSLAGAMIYLAMLVTTTTGMFSIYQWNDGIVPILFLLLIASIIWTLLQIARPWNKDQITAASGFAMVMTTAIIDAINAIAFHGEVLPIGHWGVIAFILFQSYTALRKNRETLHNLQDQCTHLQAESDKRSQQNAEHVKAMQFLEQSNREYQTKTQELTRTNQQKDQLLAQTAHDLRSPLNGIIGITESLLDEAAGKLNATLRNNLQMVMMSSKRMNNLIGDITDYSKLKNQSLALENKKLGLYDLVQEMISLFAPLVANKPVYLVNQIDPAFPPVAADENRLNQIINNLLSNSVKYTLKGNITIKAETEGKFAVIRIRDNGLGIPKDQLDELMKSSPEMEQPTMSGQRSGFGLGITKQLVEMHKGKLTVSSVENEYTEFSFTLPLADEQTDWRTVAEHRSNTSEPSTAASAPPTSVSAGAGATGTLSPSSHSSNQPQKSGESQATEAAQDDAPETVSGGRILVVDDEPINLQVLQNLLTPLNFELTLARDGFEALNIIKEQGAFDLVLLDVMMPRLSGYDVCLRIRKTFSANEMPILLLTAKNTIDDLVRGFQVGANDYLTKPFAKQELIARVQMQLKLAHHHQHVKSKSERNGF
jgi:two-component system sensor histidine kinase ChiS